MADSKLADLNPAEDLDGTELIYLSQSGNSVKIDFDTFADDMVRKSKPSTISSVVRTSIEALDDDTVEIDFRPRNNFTVTLTADADITLATDGTSGATGQSGMLRVDGAEHITGWGDEFKWKNTPDDLDGTEVFGYFIEAEDTIRIGRVK